MLRLRALLLSARLIWRRPPWRAVALPCLLRVWVPLTLLWALASPFRVCGAGGLVPPSGGSGLLLAPLASAKLMGPLAVFVSRLGLGSVGASGRGGRLSRFASGLAEIFTDFAGLC